MWRSTNHPSTQEYTPNTQAKTRCRCKIRKSAKYRARLFQSKKQLARILIWGNSLEMKAAIICTIDQALSRLTRLQKLFHSLISTRNRQSPIIKWPSKTMMIIEWSKPKRLLMVFLDLLKEVTQHLSIMHHLCRTNNHLKPWVPKRVLRSLTQLKLSAYSSRCAAKVR